MKYKLNPDHAYIVVFLFFVLAAGLKYSGEFIHSKFDEQGHSAADLEISEAPAPGASQSGAGD